MKLNLWMAGLLLDTACLAPSLSYAGTTEAATKAEKKADNKADFAAVVVEVTAEMATWGRYGFVSASERSTIDASLAQMQSFFDKFGTVAAMDKDAKLQLYEDQESVNAILTRRDDRRVVCTVERPTDSLVRKRICRTYGTVARDRRSAQEEMNRISRDGYINESKNPAMLQAQELSRPGQH